MANGVLYTVTSLGQVAALDPGTGVARWVFDPGSWKSGRPGNLGFVHRGLAYWTDGTKERLLLGTGDAYLLRDRRPHRRARFGVRRRRPRGPDGRRGPGRPRARRSATASAPIVVPRRRGRGRQHPRRAVTPRNGRAATSPGSTCRTGKRLWTFRSIPEKGALGYDTWSGDAADYTGSTNVWTTMSADDGARARLPAVRHADQRLLRRPPARRQPVRRTIVAVDATHRRAACGTSRPCTTACGTTTCRRRRCWSTSRWTAAHQGRGAGEQAGLHLRPRSQDRRAGLADRRAAGTAVDVAGRADVADAAVPDEAAGVRAPGADRRRPDRFHAGAAAAGASSR